MREQVEKLSYILVIIAFVLTIGGAGVLMVVGQPERISEIERRRLAGPPTMEDLQAGPSTYITAWSDFTADQFGLREWLIQTHHRGSYNLLGVSGHEDVILGKDGWLFYNEPPIVGGTIMVENYYRGRTTPLSEAALQLMQENQIQKREALAAQGIPYYLMIVPEKIPVYQHYLPERYLPLSSDTWLNQYLQFVDGTPEGDIINPFEILRAAAVNDPDTLYYYTMGTHWTSEGGWLGYTMLMDTIRADFPDAGAAPRDIMQPRPTIHGDIALAQRAGIDWQRTPPDGLYWVSWPRGFQDLETPEINERWGFGSGNAVTGADIVFVRLENAAAPYNVLMFRDSFTLAMEHMLLETFAQTAMIWDSYSEQHFENVTADMDVDIVIEQWAESRFIIQMQRYRQMAARQGQ
ncbi:MAG: hypothetical protein AAF125_07240 [Chloroflexota bacterium]